MQSISQVGAVSVKTTSSYLSFVIKLWAFVALIGQWMFAAYILIQFALPFFSGSLSSENTQHMIRGIVEGDTSGNAILISHLLSALVLSTSGILQLFPYIRIQFPLFHKWNGRLFLVLGIMGALTGLYLTLIKGSRLSDIGAIGVCLNGILILIFAALAWKYALKKQFQKHMRFAIHTFILVNGVWTFRLYMMGWYLVNQGPNGNNATIDGPADLIMSFACYLLPMAMAEVYFWAQKRRDRKSYFVVSTTATIGCAITIVGVVAATMMMWWPRISAGL
ncbi:DUF2306 domain-containing protein [Glaciecola sp. 1036]|uniref:DUF2306 domain-containing protein n=1 Tax=Alteromonadaceae TaxID=72275 RepID=UPI003D08A931